MSSNEIPIESVVENRPQPDSRSRTGRGRQIAVLLATGLIAIAVIVSVLIPRPSSPPMIDFNGANPAVRTAIESAIQKVKEDLRSGLAWGRLGMVLSAHEYVAESLVCYREAQRWDQWEYRWPYLLAVGLEVSDPRSAIQEYRHAIERDGSVPAPRIRLAELHLNLGQLDDAEEQLRSLKTSMPDDGRVLFRMAQLLYRRGKLHEALSLATSAHDSAPQQRQVAELVRQLRRATGKDGFAVAGDKPSIQTQTGWPDPLLESVRSLRRDPYWLAVQGQQLIAQGRSDEGIIELERAASAAPDDWTLAAQVGRIYLSTSRLQLADDFLSRSIKRFPQACDLWRLRGSSRLIQQRWAEAAEDFRKALRLKPDDAPSRSDLGFCLQRQGQLEAAKREFTEALQLDPAFSAARFQFAKLMIDMNDTDSARSQLSEFLRSNPSHEEALRLLNGLPQ